MTDKNLIKKFLITALILTLIFLSFIVVRPVLLSIFGGLLLAYLFYPIYKKLYSWTKLKNLSALLICILVLAAIFLILWAITPPVSKQVFSFYNSVQSLDLTSLIKSLFPTLPDNLVNELELTLREFSAKMASSFITSLLYYTKYLFNISLQFLLVFLVFFFSMRDGEKLVAYIKELSPLKKSHEKKFLEQFKGITNSILYGQLIVGIVQGVATGIGLFIFQVPNALLLTIFAILVGILPIIGPTLIWIPSAIYLLIVGRIFSGLGLFIYGFGFLFWIDSLLRPIIVSKRTKVHPAIVLIAMIGGLLVFGVMGLIIGPLIFSYLLILLDLYKKRKSGYLS